MNRINQKNHKKMNQISNKNGVSRRSFIKGLGATAGTAATMGIPFISEASDNSEPLIDPSDNLKVTKLETFLVKPRWIFLKVHTNAGIIGLGEPLLEGRARTIQTAIEEIEPYLIGQDPRRVTHHWQAIYRDAFYRGGPILTSALSGIDQALWDIKGKALGVPVYELLGGPTRNKIRVYAHVRTNYNYTDPFKDIKEAIKDGFTSFKTGVAKKGPHAYDIIETPSAIDYAAKAFAQLREVAGPDVNIGIDFHGAVSPATAKLLIKAYEPYQPYFIEEPVQCQNVDVLADIARGTHLPIATGERIFTKWGFREILEKGAATILQPDMCHAGGITEVLLIAGMAEAYYAGIAPHNPMGPISLAAGIQLAASIPNFLIQEQVSLGEGYLKTPFKVVDGYIPLPTGPGLGIELDEDKLEDKLGHDWQNPRHRREDGSVMDW